MAAEAVLFLVIFLFLFFLKWALWSKQRWEASRKGVVWSSGGFLPWWLFLISKSMAVSRPTDTAHLRLYPRYNGSVVVEGFLVVVYSFVSEEHPGKASTGFFLSLPPPFPRPCLTALSHTDKYADRPRGTSTCLQPEENGEEWLGEYILGRTHCRKKRIFVWKRFNYFIANTLQSLIAWTEGSYLIPINCTKFKIYVFGC